MERLLTGHFARHSRPATHAELAELAELITGGGDDNSQALDATLTSLIDQNKIQKCVIEIDHDECSQSSQPTSRSKLHSDQDDDNDDDHVEAVSSITVAYWPRVVQPPPKVIAPLLHRKIAGRVPTAASTASTASDESAAENYMVAELAALRSKRDALQQEVDALAASCPNGLNIEAYIQEHIKRLHDYNEIKDIGQMLLGKCAEREQTTTRNMYEKFGLELED